MSELIMKEENGGKIIFNERPQYYHYGLGNSLLHADGGILEIGDDVAIGIWNIISAQNHIKIGNATILAERISIRDANHSYDDMSRHIKHQGFKTAPIIIGDGVWIGAGVVITAGVNIGNGAVVGANSVVTKDIPDYAIAVGSPARVIGFRTNEGYKRINNIEGWNTK